MQAAQVARLVKNNEIYKPPCALERIRVWIQFRGEAAA
jgi:hypothetical protein